MKRASQSAQAVATPTASATRRATTTVIRRCIGCGADKFHAKGYCNVCYQRRLRRGEKMESNNMNQMPCRFEGCKHRARTKFYCSNHYLWLQRHQPEVLGQDPTKCMRKSCDNPRQTSGLCADHYDAQITKHNKARVFTRPSRASGEPRKKSVRPNYADPANIKHLVEGKPAPDDFWEFVQYELGITK